MLIYHPAFDPYHTSLRFLRLLRSSSHGSLSRQKLFMLDFYLLFPRELKGVRFPRELVSRRKSLLVPANPYYDPVDAKPFFRRVGPVRETALELVVGAGVASLDDEDIVRLNVKALSKHSKLSTLLAREETANLERFLAQNLGSVELLGPDGLKSRTGLMEHRYDPR